MFSTVARRKRSAVQEGINRISLFSWVPADCACALEREGRDSAWGRTLTSCTSKAGFGCSDCIPPPTVKTRLNQYVRPYCRPKGHVFDRLGRAAEGIPRCRRAASSLHMQDEAMIHQVCPCYSI